MCSRDVHGGFLILDNKNVNFYAGYYKLQLFYVNVFLYWTLLLRSIEITIMQRFKEFAKTDGKTPCLPNQETSVISPEHVKNGIICIVSSLHLT